MSPVEFMTARKLYITPDDHPSASDCRNLSLSHVLSHPKKYFMSITHFFLAPGCYYLKKDFIVQNVSNISIIGNLSTIKCTNLSVGIAIINVTNVVVQNLIVWKCGKTYSESLGSTNYEPTYDIPKLYWQSALLLHNCVSVVVKNLSITVNIGTSGLIVANVMSK